MKRLAVLAAFGAAVVFLAILTSPAFASTLSGAPAECRHPLFPVEAGAIWTYRSTAVSRKMGDAGPAPPSFEYKAGVLEVSSDRFVAIEAQPLPGGQETSGMTRRRAWICRREGLLQLATEQGDGAGTVGTTLPRDTAPGREWTVQPRRSATDGTAWGCRYKAVERAAVRVPNGEMTAIVIDGDCTSGPRFRVQTRDWWVEGVGLAKREVTNRSPIGVASDRIELIDFKVLPVAEATRQLDIDSPAARRRFLSARAKDPNPSVRREAVTALGAPWDPEALEVLTAALGDPDENVQHVAAAAMGHSRDPRVVPILNAALKESRPSIRRAAAHALGTLEGNGLHDTRTVAALAALLEDGDSSVRFAAAQALGDTASPQALEALAKLLRDKDPKMRATTVARIIMLADAGVDAHGVKGALQSLAAGDPDAEVRESARMAAEMVRPRE
jgi:hypothetical protein